MTAPPVYPRGDQYPPFGDWTTIKGVVSSAYLERDQQMIVRWSPFWESMTETGYVRPVDESLNPDVEARFPTVGDVMQMIAQGATTLPGERILGLRASDSGLVVRAGVDETSSHEMEVSWPELSTLINSVRDLRDETEDYATDARGVIDEAVEDLRGELMTINGIASSAAEIALDAAEGKAGNTGWVTVPLADTNLSGSIFIRRRGNDVELRLVNVTSLIARGGVTPIGQLPAGYKPPARVVEFATRSTSLSEVYRVWIEGSQIQILGGLTTISSWPSGSALVSYATWSTDDPFPA